MDGIRQWMQNSILDEILIVVIIISFIEAFAQNTIKQSASPSINLGFGLIAYMLIGYLLHYAYHKFPIGKVNVLWSAISIILAAITGYILYDEPLNYKLIAAVIFSLLAIYCSYAA